MRRRLAVLFDALFDNAVRYGEHLIDKVRKTVVFNVARCILGGLSRVS